MSELPSARVPAPTTAFADLPWETLAPGLRQKRAPGARWIEHRPEHVETDWCEKAHRGVLLDGELELEWRDGTRTVLVAGDALAIDAGADHAHRGHVRDGQRALIFLVEADGLDERPVG